ncbi:MAG: glycoside hydrolase family 5 protein [Oscillospiraceae bacterium]|nr:glycoside hydrolase family 5 protein [Oscillospiraceae bacterium]
MKKTGNKTRLLSCLLAVLMLLAISACNPPGLDDTQPDNTDSAELEEIPTVPVQLMTREANKWNDFFNSSTIEIDGDGSYSGTIDITETVTFIPMIAISAVGTTVDDLIRDGAEIAPAAYANATVTIDSVAVNGELLVLADNEDVLFVPDDGPLRGEGGGEGYANVQVWNAWYTPNQRINVEESNGVSIADMGGELLRFDDPVTSIAIKFTVNGVGSDIVPEGRTPGRNSDNDDDNGNANIPEPPVDIVITGDFNADITAEQLVAQIGAGWNLGNTLDAYYSERPGEPFHWVDHDNMHDVETAWIGGPENATTHSLIKRVKESGFNAVRIPVTWYKMSGDAPDFTIREEWLSHVQNIVNMAVAEDLYIILNTHHDEYIMRFDEDPAVGERAVTALWTQIAERFKDYDEKLIFEGLNEPRARTNDWNAHGQWNWNGNDDFYITINRWNQAFVNAVRATGGNNQLRHLMLATYGAQSTNGPIGGFELPNEPDSSGTDRFIWSIHVYSPHNWAHNGNGSYDVSAVQNDIERVANRATELGIPVIFGEWGSIAANNIDERVQHAHDYIRIATEMRERNSEPVVMACFWWDNAGDFRIINRNGANSDNGKRIINAITRAREGLPLE